VRQLRLWTPSSIRSRAASINRSAIKPPVKRNQTTNPTQSNLIKPDQTKMENIFLNSRKFAKFADNNQFAPFLLRFTSCAQRTTFRETRLLHHEISTSADSPYHFI